jgi:hypothetical protein
MMGAGQSAICPAKPKVKEVERGGQNGRASDAEAIRNRLALARRQQWEGSLCSDARSVVSSSHACTYCQGATLWTPVAGSPPAMDIARQRGRDKEDECLLKSSRLSTRLIS